MIVFKSLSNSTVVIANEVSRQFLHRMKFPQNGLSQEVTVSQQLRRDYRIADGDQSTLPLQRQSYSKRISG
jgi:hypothetical protein